MPLTLHNPDTVAAPLGPYTHAIEVPDGARAILFAGEPLREPAVSQGPFVAESREHLQRMMDDFRLGRMGRLESIAERKIFPHETGKAPTPD